MSQPCVGKIFTTAPLWDSLLCEQAGILPINGTTSCFWTVPVTPDVARIVGKYAAKREVRRGCFYSTHSFAEDQKVVVMAWPTSEFSRICATDGPAALERLIEDLRGLPHRRPAVDRGGNPAGMDVGSCNPELLECVGDYNPF